MDDRGRDMFCCFLVTLKENKVIYGDEKSAKTYSVPHDLKPVLQPLFIFFSEP